MLWLDSFHFSWECLPRPRRGSLQRSVDTEHYILNNNLKTSSSTMLLQNIDSLQMQNNWRQAVPNSQSWLVCVLQLLLRAKMMYFAPLVCIADSRENAESIMVIVSGQVEATLPFRKGGTLLRTFTRGWVWHYSHVHECRFTITCIYIQHLWIFLCKHGLLCQK